jgi:hypothetical protein
MTHIKWIPGVMLAAMLSLMACQDEVEEATKDIEFEFSEQSAEELGPFTDVCEGKNDSEDIFPIKAGNQWKWYAGGQQVRSAEITDEQVIINGADYLKIRFTEGSQSSEMYIRKGAHNAIVATEDTTKAGIELIPGPLEKGSYAINSKGDSVVISDMNTTYSTPSCEYSDLMIVEQYDAQRTEVKQRMYLKKGIGPVAIIFPDSLEMYLKEVTIH